MTPLRLEVRDVAGEAGGHGGQGRGQVEERGGSRLRGLAAVGHELVRRFETEGEAAAAAAVATTATAARQVSADGGRDRRLRKQLTDQGLDAGARHDRGASVDAPARGGARRTSTIWRILTRRGFVTPQPQKRPRSSYIRFEAEQPNERWQADVTHWQAGRRHRGGDPQHRRRPLPARHRRRRPPHHLAADVVATLRRRVRPARPARGVLTDNGAIFTARYRGDGRTALEIELGRPRDTARALPALPPADLRQGRTLPPDPEEMARQTTPARTLRQLQNHLDEFRDYYNTQPPAPRRRPTHPRPGLRRPTQSHPTRHRDRPALAGPHRHHRQVRDGHHPTTTPGSTTSASAASTPAPRSPCSSADLDIRIINRDTGQLSGH